MARMCATIVAVAAAATAAQAADLPQAPSPMAPIVVNGSLGPDMLGTAALPIRAARFAEGWSRAAQDASHSPALQRLIAPARGLPPLQQIAYVQRAVHHQVRWMSDATQWGRHDYWASAAQTLARGAGDMEDRAIVKMQALRALGIAPGNLYLTLARDRVGGPVSVLAVRVNRRFYILDDTGGAPYPVDRRRREFQPLMSFGWAGSWIHSSVTPARVLAGLPSGRN